MITQLQKDIDNHKIYLVRGKKMPPPIRYCFHCDKDVCYPFLPIDETSTTSVEFEIGGFHEGYQKIVVKRLKIDLLLLFRFYWYFRIQNKY